MGPEQLQPAKLNPLVGERLRGLCGSALSSFWAHLRSFQPRTARSGDPPGATHTQLALRLMNARPGV